MRKQDAELVPKTWLIAVALVSTRVAKVEHEMGQYAELKEKLSSIMVREEDGPLEMLTDLGADCFAKVKVGCREASRALGRIRSFCLGSP